MNVFAVQLALVSLGQSCGIHVNGLRIVAWHLLHNGAILKLITVKYVSSSALGGGKDTKKKVNLFTAQGTGKVA